MKHSAALSIAGAGTLWGLIGLFVNLLAAKGFAPLQITTLRVTAALLFTALIIWRTDIRQFFIRPKDWWMFFGNGVIGLVFFNWCYFNAIAGGSLAIAALLLYTAPVFVMLMSVILFHEKLTKEKIVALILTFVGCGCITGAFAGNLSVSRETFLYGLASGFGYALYSIFGKPATRKYSALTVSLWCFLFAAAFTLPLSGRQDGLGRYPWHRADQLCISQHIIYAGPATTGSRSRRHPGNHRAGSGRHRQLSLFRRSLYVAKGSRHRVNFVRGTDTEPERRKIVDYVQQFKCI